jgi:lipopolysaccharide/colanic/teichoic acid biosynthesis glycosyltransferase
MEVDRGNPLSNQSVKFLCYLLFGIAIPYLIWFAARMPSLDREYLPNTAIATTLAALTTWYILDRFRFYAKARRLSYVVPVNFLTFGTAFAVIGLLRAPYSTSLFFSCFLATLATSYSLTALTRFGSRPQYLAAGGRVSQLSERKNQIPIESPAELSKTIDQGTFAGSIVGELHFDHAPEWERLVANAALHGIPVYHYRQILELETGQVRIDRLSENVLGSLIPNLPYMALKRVVDVLAVIVLIPALVPLMLIIALVIKLNSKGPALFIQDRVGFRGEVFRMVKFRTMNDRVVNADADAKREDSMTKSDDARITGPGKFLRKVRLDEIPQVWNILKGEMSWIGPRPEAISLSEWYENEIPFYSYRHIVRPGVTGWAQVNQGHVTDLDDVTAKLRFDFDYVKNISHWLDMLIALKTIRVVLGGFGAK